MSQEHKDALAQGRAEGRTVRNYLEALDTHRPKRGRKRTPDSIKNRLDAIARDLPEVDPLKRLQLTQERIDLEEELERLQSDNDLEELERAFTEVAKSYAERKGISYSAFRELGVSAKTLKAAGIARSS
ncbi:MAG: hypothetical protein R2733_08615 [Acidimicrobiales bacterium]